MFVVLSWTGLSVDKYLATAGVDELRVCASLTLIQKKKKKRTGDSVSERKAKERARATLNFSPDFLFACVGDPAK